LPAAEVRKGTLVEAEWQRMLRSLEDSEREIRTMVLGTQMALGVRAVRDLLESFTVKVVDPIDGVPSTGFFVNKGGFLLTCWHVIEPGFRGHIHEVMPIEYRGATYVARTRTDLGNRPLDIGVLQVVGKEREKLDSEGYEAAPLRFPPALNEPWQPVDQDPVAALGYMQPKIPQRGTGPRPARPEPEGSRPLMLRGYIDLGNTPYRVPFADGSSDTQDTIAFICHTADVDFGMSGAALLNVRTGHVEGIVAGVPESGAVSTALDSPRPHRHPFGFAVPLTDVLAQWPDFGVECQVISYDASLDQEIIRQSKEFLHHQPYTRRPDWERRVESFLADENRDSGYLVLIGGPGAGKSAFMANRIQRTVQPIFHFIRRDEPGWGDPETLLRSLVAQLCRKHGVEPSGTLQERLDKSETAAERLSSAAALFNDILERVGPLLMAQDRREVLWIDGLDEAFGTTGDHHEQLHPRRFLPGTLPPGLFAVLSSRPGEHLHRLLNPRGLLSYRLDDEREQNVADVERFLREHADDVSPSLDSEFVRRAAARVQGNFYIATHMLERMKRNPSAPRDPDQLPEGVFDFHAEVLRSVLERAAELGISKNDVWDVLGMLALAREPLSLEHLQAFGAPECAEEVLHLASDWFHPRPASRSPRSAYEFNHVSVGEFLCDELTSNEQKRLQQKLAAACATWSELKDEPRDYALRHRLEHLIAAEAWAEFAATFADADFIAAGIELRGTVEMVRLKNTVDATLRSPRLPDEWRKGMQQWRRFLLSREVQLPGCPAAYAQEVINEFLPSAPPLWQEALGPLRSELLSRESPVLVKVSGPPALGERWHSELLGFVAISPDAQLAASWSEGMSVRNRIRVWEVESRKLLTVFYGHMQVVGAAAFSPDGTRVASGGADATVKVWHARTGRVLADCHGHTAVVMAVAFSPCGQRVASGSADDTVKVWEAKRGCPISEGCNHRDWVSCLAFSPDGRLVASGSADRTVKVWEVTTGDLFSHCSGHEGMIRSLAFSPDGKRLVSGSADRTAKVWDVRSGQMLSNYWGHGTTVMGVTFSPDGQHAVSAGADNTVRVWEAETGECRSAVFLNCIPVTVGFCFDSSTRLVAVDQGHRVFIYEWHAGAPGNP